MRRDPNVLRDGFSIIQKGVNSGLAPVSLGRDELAWAINTTFRNNYATSRPGINKCALDLSALADPATFTSAIFQGAVAFERRGQLVTMIGGRLFSIALDTWAVMDVTTPNDPNPSNRYRAWFAEAEDWIIAQDGQSSPWIYDGASSRRADTFGLSGTREVPVGTAMCFSGGRLITVSPDGTSYVAGDISGGSSGSVLYNFKDAVLKLTENDTIANGGSFSVPINAGPITAVRPVTQIDTSTGQGPTQIITTGGIFSLNAPTDRTTWSTLAYPIQTVSMVQSGGLSDRATANVNGDIWTRAFDGIRSYIVARREFAEMWVNAPMSQEMIRLINRDDPHLLSYASAATYDNRLLMTAAPFRVWGHGIVHPALAVIDFAPLAYLSHRTPVSYLTSVPAWEGMWTGLQWLQVLEGNFKGIERCFSFALNSANQIELWEHTRDGIFDNNLVRDIPIQWQVESGSFTFPRQPGVESVPAQEMVSLDGGRLYVDELENVVSFAASYRMDQDPCWHDWHSWSVCAKDATCATEINSTQCTTPGTWKQQYRKPFFLPTPTTPQSDPVANKNLNWGREAQVRLVTTGKARIKRFEATAHDQQEDIVSTPAPVETVCSAVQCSTCDTDFGYTIPIE